MAIAQSTDPNKPGYVDPGVANKTSPTGSSESVDYMSVTNTAYNTAKPEGDTTGGNTSPKKPSALKTAAVIGGIIIVIIILKKIFV